MRLRQQHITWWC